MSDLHGGSGVVYPRDSTNILKLSSDNPLPQRLYNNFKYMTDTISHCVYAMNHALSFFLIKYFVNISRHTPVTLLVYSVVYVIE
jgi:hypothetical protein